MGSVEALVGALAEPVGLSPVCDAGQQADHRLARRMPFAGPRRRRQGGQLIPTELATPIAEILADFAAPSV